MKKVLIATTNLGKFNIYKQIFNELDIDCVCLRDVNCNIDVEETGKTELENSVIKAKDYHEKTGMAVLSNDSGLIIDKLSPEDQPGVFVRRFQGKELTDQELINLYIEKINKIGGSSKAQFNVGLAIVDEQGNTHTREFKPLRFFTNIPSPIIKKGVPLDSLCFDNKTQKYLSEMTILERNAYEAEEMAKQKLFIEEIFVKN